MSISDKANNKKRSTGRLRMRAVYIAAVVVVLVGILLSLMVTFRPPAYKPVSPADPEQVSPYLTHKLGPDIYNNLQMDEPFHVLVAQDGINDIISRWEWPYQAGSASISTPMIVFEADTLMLMAAVKIARIPTVVTVSFKPELDDDGLLRLNLQHVTAGILNITPLAKAVTGIAIRNELEYATEADNMVWLIDLRDALLENKAYDPVFPMYEDSIRVAEVEMVRGQEWPGPDSRRKSSLIFGKRTP